MEAEGGSPAPALTFSMAVDSVHGRSNGTPFPVSSAPEATSPRQRAEPSGQTPDEPPASAHPESGTVTTSSGTPSEFDGGSQQQQGSKDRRKVGLSWTEAEHRQFLQGLEKLGKGDWRGISRQFVTTRTPTQVASHAQKYYIRQTNQNRRKRRASLFDLANPEQAQARSSPRASQATTGASDGELFQSKAESSRATMPEASQSCGPSHSDSMNYLQSGSAAAPNQGSRTLQTQSVACSHSSASDPRGSSQPDLGALQQREPDFSPCLLGPATVAPPSSLDAYSLGQYAAHHQAAAAAAYATAMQQQAAAAYAQALMHQQASHSMRGLPPVSNPSSGTESVNHHVPDRAAFPSPADSFPGSSDACAGSAFRRFQPSALVQPPQQHSSSPQPPAVSDSAPSAPTPSTSCYPASTACYPAATSFHPSSSSHLPWQHDAMPSLPAAISHWGHFMSHEPECRPVAEHRGFGMLGFTPSWSAKRPPGMSHNSSVGTWQQSDWGQPHSSALHHSSAGVESSDRAVSPEHVSAAANNAALPSKPAPPSKPSNDRPKAHEQAEFPAPSPFGGPSDQPATFANGKLHRPVAARPTLHGLTPPPMFSADDPNQCSNGSSMTHSQRAHH